MERNTSTYSTLELQETVQEMVAAAGFMADTFNDMAEGKLTLPVIYALNNHHMDSMMTLARKVKSGGVNADEIAVLVEFAKQVGGIEYAEQRMQDFRQLCLSYIDGNVKNDEIRKALTAYVDFVIERTK